MSDNKKPKELEIIDISKLKEVCAEYIDSIENGEYDDDSTEWIFEAAIECIYGKSVWDWINNHE